MAALLTSTASVVWLLWCGALVKSTLLSEQATTVIQRLKWQNSMVLSVAQCYSKCEDLAALDTLSEEANISEVEAVCLRMRCSCANLTVILAEFD